MSNRGGYQILDLKNKLLSVLNPTTINGAYDAVSNSIRKPILVCGMNVEDKKLSPFYMTFYKDEDAFYGYIPFHSYVIDAYEGVIKLVINKNDRVEFITD